MSSQQIVIKNPTEPASWSQKKAIFGIAMSIYNDKTRAAKLSAKPKTKAQAHKIIGQLLKVQAKRK